MKPDEMKNWDEVQPVPLLVDLSKLDYLDDKGRNVVAGFLRAIALNEADRFSAAEVVELLNIIGQLNESVRFWKHSEAEATARETKLREGRE